MNPHEVPVSFSENLTNHNLLSPSERELLASVLRHARQRMDESPDTTRSLEAVLARAVGEVLLERAAEMAGRDILEQIRQQSFPTISAGPPSPSPSPSPRPPAPSPAPGPHRSVGTPEISAGPPSPSPAPSPHPPAPAPGPHRSVGTPEISAGPPSPSPGSSPRPPASGPPRPPAPGPRTLDRVYASGIAERVSVAVEEQPEILRAECVTFDEFLAPEELEELTRYTLEREHEFHISEVISPGVEGGVINPEYRRSRVLMDLGKHGERVLDRIQTALPRVLEKLGIDAFPITRVETQITASNDGDFFRHHSDNAEEEIARRQLTFVYFFQREPKAFHGGELRLHDSRRENGVGSPTGEYRAIVPEQNQIVFFRSELLHEITPVICPSQAFADSRFTVNGWLHR